MQQKTKTKKKNKKKKTLLHVDLLHWQEQDSNIVVRETLLELSCNVWEQ